MHLKYSALIALALTATAHATVNDDCKSGNYAVCSDVGDIDDPGANQLFDLGCSHSAAATAARTTRTSTWRLHGKKTKAQKLYDKACKMKDQYGCDFLAADKKERRRCQKPQTCRSRRFAKASRPTPSAR